MTLMLLLWLAHFISSGVYYNAEVELNRDKEAASCERFMLVELVIGACFLIFKNGILVNIVLIFFNLAMIVMRTLKIEKERDKVKARFDAIEARERAAEEKQRQHDEEIRKERARERNPYTAKYNPYAAEYLSERVRLKKQLHDKWGIDFPFYHEQFEDEKRFSALERLLSQEANIKWEIVQVDKQITKEADTVKIETLWNEKRRLLDKMEQNRKEIEAWKRKIFGEAKRS